MISHASSCQLLLFIIFALFLFTIRSISEHKTSFFLRFSYVFILPVYCIHA